jgi:hypothetical protein
MILTDDEELDKQAKHITTQEKFHMPGSLNTILLLTISVSSCGKRNDKACYYLRVIFDSELAEESHF